MVKHLFQTYEGEPYQVKEDDRDYQLLHSSKVDMRMWEVNYHGGPICKRCEKSDCAWCEPGWLTEDCEAEEDVVLPY